MSLVLQSANCRAFYKKKKPLSAKSGFYDGRYSLQLLPVYSILRFSILCQQT
jgi:hypothetical protein